MKFLSIILLIPFFCFSQTGILTYKVTPELKQNKNSEKINKEIDLMTFTLKYDTENSFFSKDKHIPIDKMLSNIASIHLQSYYPWYQNRLAKETVHNKLIKGDMYKVDYDDKLKRWELSSETKVIDGYTCYKAEKKELNDRSGKYVLITAWYTPDIPSSYGPIGYGGLPGLILQLKREGKGTYLVDKMKLNPSKIKIPKPEEGKKITIKEYVFLMRKARKVTED